MTDRDDDEWLAMAAAQGDRAAFSRLLGRHYDRVYRITYGVLRQTGDAEDLTQEIWAALPAKLRSWHGNAKFTSWLYRVALNAARDTLRRRASRARAVETYGELEQLDRDETRDTRARLDWLETALATLSEDLRATAVLTLSEEMTFAQAGDVLGVAEGTVAWRMSEIKKHLKTLVSAERGPGSEALT
jgi:RNA polymerase sigma-70 factor (ECF subfamily)